jgi:hypothetical protein
MIDIPDYKLGLRNNQLTVIETKNKSRQNVRIKMERNEISIEILVELTQELV